MTSGDRRRRTAERDRQAGVTGSSPVPPTSETPASPGVFVFLTERFAVVWSGARAFQSLSVRAPTPQASFGSQVGATGGHLREQRDLLVSHREAGSGVTTLAQATGG